MAINAADIIRCASVWRFNGTDEQVNVLHLRIDANGTANDGEALEDVAEFVVEAYQPIVSSMSSLIVHDRFEVSNVTQGLVYGSQPGDAGLNGTQSGDALPPQNTALLLMQTLISRVQGRIYLPTFGEVENGSGVVSGSVVTAMETMGTYLLTSHAMTNGLELHYAIYRGGTTTVVPFTRRAVPRYRTQKRRTVGRGS